MSPGRGLRSSLAVLALILGLLAPAGAAAVLPDEVLDDPVLENRARELSRLIRLAWSTFSPPYSLRQR